MGKPYRYAGWSLAPVLMCQNSRARGFPDSRDWHRPRPIYARSESIEATGAFAEAFREGQRGIVLMRTFNEAPDVEGPTVQHTITPGDDGMLAAAFLWRLRTGFTATGWREKRAVLYRRRATPRFLQYGQN